MTHKLDEADNLRLQLHLARLESIQSQLQFLQTQVTQLLTNKSKIEGEMRALAAKIKEKYGVDPMTVSIDEEGNIHERAPLRVVSSGATNNPPSPNGAA